MNDNTDETMKEFDIWCKKKKLIDIAIEGGGVRGLATAIAIQRLQDSNFVPRNIIGTSAGALVAAMLGQGITGEQLFAFLSEKTESGATIFSSFMEVPEKEIFTQDIIDNSLLIKIFKEIDIPFIPEWVENGIDTLIIEKALEKKYLLQAFHLMEFGSMFSNANLRKWLTEKLEQVRPGISNMTMKEACPLGDDNISHVSFIVTNVTKKKSLVINRLTFPNAPYIDMAIASSAIPQFFPETIWREEWGETDDVSEGDIIVDGGVLKNFGIKYIMNPKEKWCVLSNKTMGIDSEIIYKIGILLDESKKAVLGLDNAQEKDIFDVIKDSNMTHRIGLVVDTMLSHSDRQDIEKYRNNVCALPVGGIGTVEFDLSEYKLYSMVKAAEDEIENFVVKLFTKYNLQKKLQDKINSTMV